MLSLVMVSSEMSRIYKGFAFKSNKKFTKSEVYIIFKGTK